MKSNINIIALLGVCLGLTALHTGLAAATEAVQWPAGFNVCQGTWTYQEYQPCADASHGADMNSPILVTDGGICGYQKMSNTCWNGSEIRRIIITPQEHLSRNDDNWQEAEISNYCAGKGLEQPLGDHETLGTVSIESVVTGRDCRSRDHFNKCDRYHQNADVQCRVNIMTAVLSANSAACGLIDNPSQPLSCNQGYRNIVKRSSACASTSLTSPQGIDASRLISESWRYGFYCSTGDDRPAESYEEVQAKYSFLVGSLQKIRDVNHPDLAAFKNALQSLISNRSNHLEPQKVQDAEKILSSDIVATKIRDGSVFDASKDCLVDASGNAWACQSKKVTLDFGDLSHLANISPYTSMTHKLSYTFNCLANSSQLTATLREGSDVFSLAPTSSTSLQSTSIVYKSSFDLPLIDLVADRSASLPASCGLNVQFSNIEVDPTLLLSSTNVMISKLIFLYDFKAKLDTASQLSAKFDTVKTLKQRISDQISEDTFKCQDIASSSSNSAESLCPLLDNSAQYCSVVQTPMAGELGLLMDRIKQNGCLSSDLEKGLPATVACNSQTGNSTSTVCLAGIQKVAKLLDAEYLKNLESAQRLADALNIEKARISSIQAELAKKISIVIDALTKGLPINSSIPAAPTVEPNPPAQGSKPLLIYNGESAPFFAGQGWDITQSTVAESTANPASGTSHLRYTLNYKNFWGAAAYAWNSYQALDLSGYSTITFKASSPQAASIKVYLVAMETNIESSSIDLVLTEGYQFYTIDLDTLKTAGFDLTSPQALVVATISEGEASYTIDIDDITANL